MEKLKKFKLERVATKRIMGGATSPSEDVPITTLGTITNDGEG